MSLIPYHPREGREIVLRHHNAIVVRDPSSQRLEIRGLQPPECPTCHRPFRSASPERHYEHTSHGETYVDPNYFRMLRAGHDAQIAAQPRPPPSPIRRLTEPVVDAARDADEDAAEDDARFLSGSPTSQGGGRIKREAFSPHYFNTFFIEEKELGRGGKGVVLLVRHEIDGCNLGHFACKRVPVGDDHAWLEKVLVEVELLAKLTHPNLVSYRHVWLEDVQLTRFGPSVACAFILQQYCNGGDLLHHVIGDMPKEATKEELKAQMRRRSRGQAERPQVQKRLLPEEIYSLFKDITSGLAYLHAANYIHRDLKPSNCLLHRDGNQLRCLISDFGEVQPENAVRKSTGSTGTISYCAPEVLKKDTSGTYGNFTTKSDIFSLGMILYFMCFGRLPYINANTVHEELEDIGKLRAEISGWEGFQDERKERPDLPSKLYQLLKKLLSVNPVERPTAQEVLGAMVADSSLEGTMRSVRNANPLLGLSGQRIQSLDSPMPPGSPVLEPNKRARVNSTPDDAADDTLPSPFSRASRLDAANTATATTTATGALLTKRISPPPRTTEDPTYQQLEPNPTLTSQSMTLSRSNRSHHHNPAQSPRRRPSPLLQQPSGNTPSAATTAPVPPPATATATATITTPLLMPPPTTRTERARHAAVVAVYRVSRWAAEHAVLLRGVLFAAKVVSLSAGCWPWSAAWGVMGVVLGLAGVDLLGGYNRYWEGSDGEGYPDGIEERFGGEGYRGVEGRFGGEGGLGGREGGGVAEGDYGSLGVRERDYGVGAAAGDAAVGEGEITAVRGTDEDEEGEGQEDGEGDGGALGIRGARSAAAAFRSGVGRWWAAGWRRSLLLLVAHCVVLAVASRLGVLCAGPGRRGGWEEWRVSRVEGGDP